MIPVNTTNSNAMPDQHICECWCGCHRHFYPYITGMFFKRLVTDICPECNDSVHIRQNTTISGVNICPGS